MKENDQKLLIWGIHPVEEVLKVSSNYIDTIFVLPSFGKKKNQAKLLKYIQKKGLLPQTVADFHRFRLPQNAVHQGICAYVSSFWETDLSELISIALNKKAPIVICDQIEDPQNLGGIIRATVGFFACGLIIPPKNNARINGTVIKASSGALFHTKVCTRVNIQKAILKLKEQDIPVVGLDAHGAQEIFSADFSLPLALVLGSESRGIRKNVKKELDLSIRIPINKVLDSLNVSCSACVALYEISKKLAELID